LNKFTLLRTNMLYNIYYFIILIGIILSSFLFLKKDDSPYLKYFAPFLFLTLFIELLCLHLANNAIHTISIASSFNIIEVCFYMWVLGNIIKSKKIKKTITFMLIVFPILSIINLFFFQGIHNYNTITFSVGCLILIFLSIYYFYELFKLQHAVRLSTDPGFWICTGLLFFYCCSFPVYVSINIIKNFSNELGHIITFVLAILNVILYSLFCIAFLCKIRIRKYSL